MLFHNCLSGTSSLAQNGIFVAKLFKALKYISCLSDFSSPEQEVLMVSYCDRSMLVVHRMLSVVNNLLK